MTRLNILPVRGVQAIDSRDFPSIDSCNLLSLGQPETETITEPEIRRWGFPKGGSFLSSIKSLSRPSQAYSFALLTSPMGSHFTISEHFFRQQGAQVHFLPLRTLWASH